MATLVHVAVLAAMAGCLLLIPFGLPGLWLIGLAYLALAAAGSLSWTAGLEGLVVVAAVEAGEFLLLRRFGKRYGGSPQAFWGAVVGGMAGLFVGIPVPVVGPLITAFLGTFAGAGLVTYLETRSLERSARVGWGVLLARTAAVALKVGAGAALIASAVLALLF